MLTYLSHWTATPCAGSTEPKNALIKQYVKLFDGQGEAEFDKRVLDFIVDKAIEYRLARGLRSICEAIMTDAMYEAPGNGVWRRSAHHAELCAGEVRGSRMSQLKVA